MTYKVSIIVPVYNGEKYLKKCINSILNQTLKEIEIIVVDDGSSDNSGQIIDSFCKIDTRIVAIHIKNGGPAKARNIGIEVANGEYIGFVDSDDWVESNMFEILYNTAILNNSGIACCGYKIISKKNVSNVTVNRKRNIYDIQTNGNDVFEMFVSSTPGIFSVWNKIYKRNNIIKNSIKFSNDLKSAEDCEFNIKSIVSCSNIIFIDNLLYNYYLSEESLTRGYINDCMQKHLDWLNIINNNIPKYILQRKDNVIAINSTTITSTIFAINNDLKYKNNVNITGMISHKEIKNAILITKIKTIKGIYYKILFFILKYKIHVLYKTAFNFLNTFIKLKQFLKEYANRKKNV